jgi:hypothetical protein
VGRDGLVDAGGSRGAFHQTVDGALCQWAAMAGSEDRVIGASVALELEELSAPGARDRANRELGAVTLADSANALRALIKCAQTSRGSIRWSGVVSGNPCSAPNAYGSG